jgi:hypothetical protein
MVTIVRKVKEYHYPASWGYELDDGSSQTYTEIIDGHYVLTCRNKVGENRVPFGVEDLNCSPEIMLKRIDERLKQKLIDIVAERFPNCTIDERFEE